MTVPPAPTARRRGWWADRGVMTKVLVAVGLAALAAAVIGGLGIRALSATAGDARDLYRDNLAGALAAADVGTLVDEMRIDSRDAVLAGDPATARASIDATADLDTRFQQQVATYRATGLDAANEALLEQLEQAMDQYLTVQKTALSPLALTGDVRGWVAVNAAQAKPLVTVMTDAAGKLQALETRGAAREAARAEADYHDQRLLVLLIMVVGIAAAGTVGVLVARGIGRATHRVKEVAAALAEGDLTRTTGLASGCELGQMGASLDTAVTRLRTVMTSLAASADAVAVATEELTTSAGQIADSAEETGTQSGVVASAAEEVSRSVETVAAGAEQMNAAIREISLSANDAARVAGEAVSEAARTNEAVSKLGESSREIGAVVKTITSIAEQTNLLALNATIEAARAGEAGKGFAVVANEVKELAQATAKATEDISRRVLAIQGDTGSAVEAIGRIGEVISSINDYQLTIASAVEEQTATTNEMSRSVQEAAGGAGEIAMNITGVSTAAQTTSQALTQTHAAVDELSRMATGLRGIVGQFSC